MYFVSNFKPNYTNKVTLDCDVFDRSGLVLFIVRRWSSDGAACTSSREQVISYINNENVCKYEHQVTTESTEWHGDLTLLNLVENL